MADLAAGASTSCSPSDRGRLQTGARIAVRHLRAVDGTSVPVPDPERLIHLQFRRFAGCPVCNLHLRSLVRRQADIAAAGIREVVVFHSPEDELRTHVGDIPFHLVADPEQRLYAEFGVTSAPRALLSPRAWLPIARAVLDALRTMVREHKPAPPLKPHGGRFGLPADFLIASDGQVLACKYGDHVDDQWSANELLLFAEKMVKETSCLRQPAADAPG